MRRIRGRVAVAPRYGEPQLPSCEELGPQRILAESEWAQRAIPASDEPVQSGAIPR